MIVLYCMWTVTWCWHVWVSVMMGRCWSGALIRGWVSIRAGIPLHILELRGQTPVTQNIDNLWLDSTVSELLVTVQYSCDQRKILKILWWNVFHFWTAELDGELLCASNPSASDFINILDRLKKQGYNVVFGTQPQ